MIVSRQLYFTINLEEIFYFGNKKCRIYAACGVLQTPIEEYKKRGYAKELLGECQNWAKDQGCLEFASDCELNNEDSLKFHLKMGFAEANRIICFTKRLTDLEE